MSHEHIVTKPLPVSGSTLVKINPTTGLPAESELCELSELSRFGCNHCVNYLDNLGPDPELTKRDDTEAA